MKKKSIRIVGFKWEIQEFKKKTEKKKEKYKYK
jgi:hypothetical protein